MFPTVTDYIQAAESKARYWDNLIAFWNLSDVGSICKHFLNVFDNQTYIFLITIA